jgi:hypothetical protein
MAESTPGEALQFLNWISSGAGAMMPEVGDIILD